MKAQRGLTVIELVFALAIAAIVSCMAASALGASLEAARSGTARGQLLASLMQAAGRASISGIRAVLCPSSDGRACTDDADWSAGWIVFLDSNASRELDGGERVIRQQQALPGKVRLRSTVGRTRIVFQGNGGNAGSNVTFTLCDGRGPSRAVSLVAANNGRLRDGVPSPEAVAQTCVP
jgi:type IV fimbrial biogenesis protein FimT